MSRTTNDAQHPETPLAPAAASASAPASSLDLRARAEARLVARGKLPSEPLTREASQQLIHELSVHQIELEIQNEELRRSQTELEASRARYFELYDLAPVGYVALNDGGLITEANLAAARLLDLPRQALINRRLSNWIKPDDQDIFYLCRRQLNAKAPQQQCELRLQRPDGSSLWAALALSLQPERESEAHCLVVLNDIDVHKQLDALRSQAEEDMLRVNVDLGTSEARAHAVINASPVPLAITQKSGCVDHLNPAFVATFGYALDEIPTWSHWWNRAAPEPAKRARILAKLRKRTATSAQSGKPCSPFEITVRCQDGREANVIILVTELGDDQRLNTLYDITELSQAREAAQQAARAKTDFLSQMSHEIRTPLNAALGMTEVLERTHLDSEQLHLVRQVRMAGRSLLEILNDILDISRIEAGAMQLEQRPFALSSVVEAVLALLSSAAQQQEVRLAISAAPAVPGALLGDARRLKQVLINLVGNAIKFTKHGGVRVEITLLEETTKAVSLRFEVVDTGIGIPPEILEHLFEPFVQGSVGVTRRFGGTGLGLSICRRLVDIMGGTIGAESLPGIGSLFWFDLTFERTSEKPEVFAPTAPVYTGEPRLASARVLLVDDSAMNQEVGQRLLALEGASVTLATDGRNALELLSSGPGDFDLVLMDVQMPEMDGLTATRRIRSELGLTELPIVALTAGVLPAQQAAARRAGMNAVLIKPLDTEQMIATLRQCMRLEPTPSPSSPPPSTKAAEPLPAIPGIDPVQAIRITGGNPALFEKLLSLFADECPSILTNTREALKIGDRALASRLMHSLRGNASILGASEIMDTAKVLEDAIEAEETDLARPLEELAKQMAPLIAASTAAYPAQTASATQAKAAPQEASEAPDAKLKTLPALKAILHANNLDALAHFDRLRPELNKILGETRTEALGREISKLRFTEALALLEPAPVDGGQNARIAGE
ncbi:ATP-binding protein [Thiorhodovibrio frisius]|nr:ATP-binding protein [Thiorhodovibrio frisius]WPL22480.1 Sensory/regulatory protein RpfC [Thiorhodovibrio frisius]